MRSALVCLLALAVVQTAARADERPIVVAIRTATAGPYDAALGALRSQLDDRVALRVEDVDAKSDADADRVAALSPRVVVAVGTRATTWSRDHLPDVPIVFLMVLNPVSGGLVDSMPHPGGRITGAALDVPPRRQLAALHAALGARRIAVLFDPDETGELIVAAQAAASRAGLTLVPIEVREARDLAPALEQLEDVDALWSVADRTVLAREVLEQILLYTLRESLPFMGLSPQYVRAGALLALETSYEENGRQAATLVERVLAGELPASLPIATPAEIGVVFNPRIADRLDVKLAAGDGLALRAVE